MKTLKLNKLQENQLAEREMKEVNGGLTCCGCGCCYADNGGDPQPILMGGLIVTMD